MYALPSSFPSFSQTKKKKNPKNQKEKKMERLRHFHILPPVPTGNTLILSIDINHGMCCRI